MLSSGIITPATSAWAFSMVVVKKKDGNTRICVDYRQLNQQMKPDCFPNRNMEETLEDLNGCLFFVTLDLLSAYWQIPVSEK